MATSEKFEIIKSILTKYKFKNMVSYMCKISEVSRSGYYKYFSSDTVKSRESKEVKDLEIKGNILKAYNFKGRKKCAKQIKMTLNNHFGINYNLKRIRRIMKNMILSALIEKLILIEE